VLPNKKEKTTMRNQLIPRAAMTKEKRQNIKSHRGCRENEAPVKCWWGCKIVQLL
jgi:hypothetical protein